MQVEQGGFYLGFMHWLLHLGQRKELEILSGALVLLWVQRSCTKAATAPGLFGTCAFWDFWGVLCRHRSRTQSKSGHSVVLLLPLAEGEDHFLPFLRPWNPASPPSLWGAAGQGCFQRTFKGRDGCLGSWPWIQCRSEGQCPSWGCSSPYRCESPWLECFPRDCQLLFLWINHFLDMLGDTWENLDNKKKPQKA